jgi:hypothetical protein
MNALSKEKQQIVIGSLAEGASIRSGRVHFKLGHYQWA